MPDDLNAYQRLESASRLLRHALGRVKGLDCWGDGVPHHPDQTPGMTEEEIKSLERRPTLLLVDQLTIEECDYFFSHASYGREGGDRIRHAVRYFLPRYMKDVLANAFSGSMLWDFGTILSRSHWWRWRRMEAEISDWLVAWLNSAARFERKMPTCDGGVLLPYSTFREEGRQLKTIAEVAIDAGLGGDRIVTEMATWELPIVIRTIASLIARESYGVKLELRTPMAPDGNERSQRHYDAFMAFRRWLLSDELRAMLEWAVLDEQFPREASAALSSVELLAVEVAKEDFAR